MKTPAWLEPPLRVLSVPYVLWLLLALPGVWQLYGYWRESIFYGELIHASGELSAQLLVLTMAATPLGLLFPRARWVRWLKARRRYFGVAAFGYALLHAVVYVQRRPDLATIVEDAMEAAMWTGWLSLLLMLPLAATSNNASVRMLRRGWQMMHRLVYAVALLAFIHWILSAFNPLPGYIYLGMLLALETVRVSRMFRSSLSGIKKRRA